MRAYKLALVLGSVAAGASVGCSDSDSDSAGSATLERQLQTAVDKTPVMLDAYRRLVNAVEGGAPDGVILNDNGAVTDALIDVDLDDDGQRETSLNVRFQGDTNIDAGVLLFASGPLGTRENASGTADRQENGTTQFTGISGSFPDMQSTDELILFSGTLTLDSDGVQVLGQIGFELLSELSGISRGTLFFENNGSGFQIRAVEQNNAFEIIVRD